MLGMPRLAAVARHATPARPATGFGCSPAEVVGSALGELVERYSASLVPPDRLGAAPGRIEDWMPFARQQLATPGFPFADASRVAGVPWTESWEAVSASPSSIPADLAYLACSSERQWCTITSNGLGAGRTLGRAAASAMLELVERDAFMRAWYAATSGPCIELAAFAAADAGAAVLGDGGMRLVRRLAMAGARVTLVVLPSALDVPVVLACARSERVGLAVGCAAKPSAWRAARAALIEASQTFDWANVLVAGGEHERYDELQDHVAYHAPVERAGLSAFLDSGPRVAPETLLPTTTLTVRDVIERFAGAGWPLHLVDVGAPDVRQAGWHVIRAASPAVATLDTGPIHEAQHAAIAHRIPHPFP